MKSLVVLCFIGVVLGLPQSYKDAPRILQYSYDQVVPNSYRFLYETSDGSRREELGDLVNEGQQDEYEVVRGIYSYIGPDNVNYTVAYIADKDGFRPEGEHLPPAASVKRTKPLGIPSAALASLAG